MKSYNILLTSKNRDSLYKFSKFIKNATNLNFNSVKKSFKKCKKKNVFTILKSPHVNKKAQEQFEIRFFSEQIQMELQQAVKFLILLKKVKNHLYTDVNIKVKAINNKKLSKKIFNPDNYINTNILKNYRNVSLSELKKEKEKNYNKMIQKNFKNKDFLNIIDVYGKY